VASACDAALVAAARNGVGGFQVGGPGLHGLVGQPGLHGLSGPLGHLSQSQLAQLGQCGVMPHLGQVNALSQLGGVGTLSQFNGQVGGINGFGALLEQRRLGLMAAHELIHGRDPGLGGVSAPRSNGTPRSNPNEAAGGFPGQTASPPPTVAAAVTPSNQGASQNETHSAAALLQLMGGGPPVGDAGVSRGAPGGNGAGAPRDPERGSQPAGQQQQQIGNPTQTGNKQTSPTSAAAWRLVAGESGGSGGVLGSGGGYALPGPGPGPGRDFGLNTQTQNTQHQNQQTQHQQQNAGPQHLAASGGLGGTAGGSFGMHTGHNTPHKAGTLHNLQLLQNLQQLQQLHSAASGGGHFGGGGFGGDAGLLGGDFHHQTLFNHQNQLWELHALHGLGAGSVSVGMGHHGGSPFASQLGQLGGANQLGQLNSANQLGQLNALHVLQAQATGNAAAAASGGISGGQQQMTAAAAQHQHAMHQNLGVGVNALHAATPNQVLLAQAGVGNSGALGGFIHAMTANGDAARALQALGVGFPNALPGGAGPGNQVQNGVSGLANDLETLRRLQTELGVFGNGLGANGGGVDGLLHSDNAAMAGRVPIPDPTPAPARVAKEHTLGQLGPADAPVMSAAAKGLGVSAEMLAQRCSSEPKASAALAEVGTTITAGDPVDEKEKETRERKRNTPDARDDKSTATETTEPAAGGTRDLLATEKEKAPHAETEKSERGAVTKETAETVA
jgi:hypothetical protein